MADLAQDRPAASPTGAEPDRAALDRTAAPPPIQRITKDLFSRQGVKAIGLERAPHKDIYHFVLGRSWPSFFLLVAMVFVVTNMLFAWLYLAEPGSITNARPGSFEDALNFSVQTLATIGYGGMSPASRYGHVVVALEAIVGILMVALITGITFTRFARPTARVLFSNKVVISPRDGVPHVMFRMANWRGNLIVEAQLHVVILAEEHTAEGDVFRRPVELPLVRDRNATFILSWTAMHKIDEKSPFFGEDPLATLRAQNAQIFLSLSGLDETMGQTIHARYNYSPDDCVVNARFADVVTPRHDGSRLVDYSFFHHVIPLGDAESTSLAAPPDARLRK